jgi:hypothetical protein
LYGTNPVLYGRLVSVVFAEEAETCGSLTNPATSGYSCGMKVREVLRRLKTDGWMQVKS